jgi:hypothetical protein
LRKGATPRSGETTRKNHAKGFIRLKQLLGKYYGPIQRHR